MDITPESWCYCHRHSSQNNSWIKLEPQTKWWQKATGDCLLLALTWGYTCSMAELRQAGARRRFRPGSLMPKVRGIWLWPVSHVPGTDRGRGRGWLLAPRRERGESGLGLGEVRVSSKTSGIGGRAVAAILSRAAAAAGHASLEGGIEPWDWKRRGVFCYPTGQWVNQSFIETCVATPPGTGAVNTAIC